MDEYDKWVSDGKAYMERACVGVRIFVSRFSYDPMHIDDEYERRLRPRVDRCKEGLWVAILQYAVGRGHRGRSDRVLVSLVWDPEGAWEKQAVDILRSHRWHLQTRGTKAAGPAK